MLALRKHAQQITDAERISHAVVMSMTTFSHQIQCTVDLGFEPSLQLCAEYLESHQEYTVYVTRADRE
jgi:hypothetical protein